MLLWYILRKERTNIVNKILFCKYHVLSLLGSGGSSSVYLAEHVKLKAFRAIKCISKTQFRQPSFLLEASLLINLKNPGIPIIYDIEEDESNFYIIEEYIQGESLHAYVQNHDNISLEAVLSFGIQLCSLLAYLHSQITTPILYLDMKPEHIILCGKQLKLIDFGISTLLNSEGNRCQSFGTKGFAAPEQFGMQQVGVQTDIYGIGAVLYYLLTKKLLPLQQETVLWFPKYCSKNFKHIIQKATACKMEHRYQSAQLLQADLQEEFMYRTGKSQEMHLLKKIIVTGSQERIGATHVAISLVCWLNRKYKNAFYEENNNKKILGQWIPYQEGFKVKDELLYCKTFQAVSDSANAKPKEAGILVQDYGSELLPVIREALPDIVILVVGSKLWELEQALKAYKSLSGEDNVKIICNYNHKQMARNYAKIFHKKIYCFPLDKDPLVTTKEKSRLFEELLAEGREIQ